MKRNLLAWDTRRALLLKQIEALDADVLCLQVGLLNCDDAIDVNVIVVVVVVAVDLQLHVARRALLLEHIDAVGGVAECDDDDDDEDDNDDDDDDDVDDE